MRKLVLGLVITKFAHCSPRFSFNPAEIFAYRDSRITIQFDDLDKNESYHLYFLDEKMSPQKKLSTQLITFQNSSVSASVQIKKEGPVNIGLVSSQGELVYTSKLQVKKSLNFIATLKQIAEKIFK